MARAALKKTILITGLLLVALLGFFAVIGLRIEAAGRLAERKRLETGVRSALPMLANADRIKHEPEVLERQLQELSKKLPGERQSAEVLWGMERLARRSGVTLGQVRRRPARTQDLYVEIPTEIEVAGSFEGLAKFADRLSQLERLVNVTEFQVRWLVPPGRAPSRARSLAPEPVRAQMVTVVFQDLPEPPPHVPPQ